MIKLTETQTWHHLKAVLDHQTDSDNRTWHQTDSNKPTRSPPGTNEDPPAGLNMCDSACMCVCLCVCVCVCAGVNTSVYIIVCVCVCVCVCVWRWFFLRVSLGDCSINSCVRVTSSNDRMTETCFLLSVLRGAVKHTHKLTHTHTHEHTRAHTHTHTFVLLLWGRKTSAMAEGC